MHKGNIQTFNPFELLKFKENDYSDAFKNFNTIRNEAEENTENKEEEEVENVEKKGIKLNLKKKKHKKRKYESTRKMLENIDHQHKYEEKLNHNAKLFLNHVKKNIDKIEDIAHNRN
jgi:hypothetical protein